MTRIRTRSRALALLLTTTAATTAAAVVLGTSVAEAAPTRPITRTVAVSTTAARTSAATTSVAKARAAKARAAKAARARAAAKARAAKAAAQKAAAKKAAAAEAARVKAAAEKAAAAKIAAAKKAAAAKAAAAAAAAAKAGKPKPGTTPPPSAPSTPPATAPSTPPAPPSTTTPTTTPSTAPSTTPALVTQSATVTVSKTESYTASDSSPVSATASWGLPPITETATDTVSTTDTESSTQSATVTATGTGLTASLALAAATLSATIIAGIQAQVAALTAASYQAALNAHLNLVPLIVSKQSELYAQALAAAKAAAIARAAASPASTTPDAPVTNCGPTVVKADGTPWTCTFDDEFSGTALDTSKWTAWNNANWWGDKTMCYESDPAHVAVGGGTLNLTVTRNTAGEQCQTPLGATTPAYQGAVVTTKDNFSQQYGRFEARIRYSGTSGVHSNFWLYADQDTSTRAEIDVAEAYGANGDQMVGATHVAAADGSDAGTWTACGLPDFSAGFHTYAVEWTPTTVTFTYDDNACTSWSIPRSSFATPGSFDQKLFMILQTQVDDGTYSPAPTDASQFPATTQVDWVRVWK